MQDLSYFMQYYNFTGTGKTNFNGQKLFMKQIIVNRKWAFTLGALLAFPAAYFIFIALLKYGLGSSYFFDNAQPLLERMGIKEPLGWNINLLIFNSGPPMVLTINLFFSFLKIRPQQWERNFFNKVIHSKVLVEYRAGNFFRGAAGNFIFYVWGENCRCQETIWSLAVKYDSHCVIISNYGISGSIIPVPRLLKQANKFPNLLLIIAVIHTRGLIMENEATDCSFCV